MSKPLSTLSVLAFEPFDSGSHKAVRQSISQHSNNNWTWITRPGRAWKWRMRLSAIEMLNVAAKENLLNRKWDVIFATSLTSISDLRALLPASMRQIPIVLYMHENQAAYPKGFTTIDDKNRDYQFALTNLTSMLAADKIIWNSNWNKTSFLAGIKKILKHGSDLDIKTSYLNSEIEIKSCIVWPPVEPPPPDVCKKNRTYSSQGKPVRVVWPHRWEHDKGPDELLEIATKYTEKWNLRWTILGEQYRDIPEAMVEFQNKFTDRIDHFGYAESKLDYWNLLLQCDWVLSTARHEFFGIAVVEALLAGCLPWLPDRLSYPELLPDSAKKLNPGNTPEKPHKIINAIQQHLSPALAANAVNKLDSVLFDSLSGK